ncbi:hypothetical protein BDW02DRAFT_82327 [Decorospora gaudefroyi]|uniref:Protein kinase domain-containing protein n=1 Tax=Decorospora gaudefroyi TaxID=184978 RepID=A0A6A5KPC1_9PLEO|nr:hypothetical protein BDW02DRAFT_82327 [Decorospora gaudefroyi]
MYNSYHNSSDEINERVLLITTTWLKTEKQLHFLARIWEKLDQDHQAIQTQVLRLLLNKLEAAICEMQKLEKKQAEERDGIRQAKSKNITEYKRWKYPFIKRSLDETIGSLKKWQQIFDPTWLLILRISDRLIDVELANTSSSSSTTEVERTGDAFIATAKTVRNSLKPPGTQSQTQTSIFLPSEGISTSARTPILYSTASLLQRSSKNKTYVLDTVISTPNISPAIQNEDVRDLARKLTATDPLRFGLLQCRGVVKVLDPHYKNIESYEFIFHIPPGLHSPKSLRAVLIEANPGASLSTRFHIAQQLAQSLSYVHTYGFVHKSIRPETVLIFQNEASELAASFLLGFEKFRAAQPGRTSMVSDAVWYKSLYRHPRRQGLRPEDEYVMQHDIYSLGVCLLEIGLWDSFVVCDMAPTDNDGSTSHKIEHSSRPSNLLPTVSRSENDERKAATLLQDALVTLAQLELPSRMGDKYTDIVVSCLTCLDESNPDFSNENEFKDQDDVVIGVRYIEKILMRLSNISV